MKKITIFLFIILAMAVKAGFSQELTQEFINAGYTVTDMGSINLVPTNYGGLTIKSTEPNTLYIGGAANGSLGAIYKVQLLRDPVNHHITGFAGDAVWCSEGENNDGGLFFAPNGTFLYTQYNQNHLGQILPDRNKISIPLDQYGVESSVGSVALVPSGYPGAGNLIFASYNAGIFYHLPYTIDASGFYVLANKIAEVDVNTAAPGPEGIAYVPQGSAGFPNLSMLVSSYSSGKVVVYEVGNEGLPIVSTAKDMITGMTGAEGAWIDPVTGDFLFSTFGGGNKIIRVSGFHAPSGIAENLSAGLNISVSPNPATGPVTVQVSAPGSSSAEILDIMGRSLFRKEMKGSGSFVYDISGEPEGIYFIRLINESGSLTKKFVKR